MRRTLLILGPVAGVILLLVLALQIARPFAEKWVMAHLESFSRAELPVIVSAREFRLSFLLPQAELIGVKVEAKPELKVGDLSAEADRVAVKLDFLQLLAGRLQLSGAIIEGLSTEVDLDPLMKGPSKPAPIDWAPIFQLLRKIPISRLALQNASVQLQSRKLKLAADLDSFDLLLLNETNRLHARLDLQDAELSWTDLSTPLRVQAEAILTPQGLDVSDLRILGLGSLLHGSASFTKISDLLVAPEGSAQFELKAALPQVSKLLQNMRKVPDLQGNVELKGNAQLTRGNLSGGGFRLFAKDVAIGKIGLGQIETEGHLANRTLEIPRIAWTNPAGLADITNVAVKLENENGEFKSASVKAKAHTESLDLHDLLQLLGVGDLPLEAFVGADFGCEGDLWPATKVTCAGKATGDEIELAVGKNAKKVLFQTTGVSGDGSVTLDLEKAHYDVNVQVGDDHGKSSGTVIYDKGFDIDFQTPRLNFSHVKKIADLRIEGSARIEGKTMGNADTAKFQMNVDGQDLVFEDFALGQPRGHVRYDSGTLYFEDMQGTLGASTYQGELAVDLEKDRMRATFQSDNLDLGDVAQALERRIKIPFDLSGVGSAHATVSGPLQINQLSYQGQIQVPHGIAAGESFEKMDIGVHSNAGEFEFDKATVMKGGRQIVLTGVGHPSGQIDFLAKGTGIPLEQSENVSSLDSNISGLLDFSLKITDNIKSPHMNLAGKATDIVIEEQELPSIDGQLQMDTHEMTGGIQLTDGKLETKFQIPFEEEGAYELQAQAKDWNFTTAFALLGAGPLLGEYQSSLTATLDLKSERGGFWKSTGKGRIDRLFLKRGNLSLENTGPMDLLVHNGSFSFLNFDLKGPNAHLTVLGDHNTRENLNMRVSAQAELRLLQIFLPFLEELSGRATAEMTLAGPMNRPDLLGSAKTENGFVKIKNFVHPIEKIAADVQFSQSKVVINSVTAELGGGAVQGQGVIAINGYHDFPTQIHLQLQNATLNVPDHVRTSGSGEFDFSGNWFPFLLAGTYHVQSGLFDKEISGDDSQNIVKKSTYLPKMVLQRTFEPITLDLQIILDQPLAVKSAIGSTTLIDGTVTGQLEVKGTPSAAILLGQINTEKSSKITLRTNVFDVITGNIKFTDPKEINPELYVSARTRVNDYDINMVVQGTGKNPIVHTTSVPALSEQDIISLLALGVTSSSTDPSARRMQTNSHDQQDSSSSTYQIGTAVLQQIPLFQQAQKATGFNVQFSSNYDDTRNVETKTITVSRQLGERVKISAARLVSDQNSTEAKLTYSLNPNVSAIGSFQKYEVNDSTNTYNSENYTGNIFGLDLEFRQEFR